MIFHRTAAGLSNMYLFSGVDAVVLVEGGQSLSEEAVQAGEFGRESQDIAFWQRWFAEVMPQMSIQFRAVGSKPTLHAIALKVASGSIAHVYVAMDRDHDNRTGVLLNCPKVLYTRGYSWENEVWNETVLEEVFYALCSVCRNTTNKEIRALMANCFSAFDRDTRWVTKADYICFVHNLCWCARKHPYKIIQPGTKELPPAINKRAVVECVREAKAKRTGMVKTAPTPQLNTRLDCCGHLIAAYGYSLLVYAWKRFCKGMSYPRDLVDAIVIDKFFGKVKDGSFPVVRAHYERQMTA